MMQVCHFCGNTHFTQRIVTYLYRHNGSFLLVNNVPCEQCEFCGEQYFEAKVLKRIEQDFQDIYAERKRVQQEIRVPCEEFVMV